MRPKQSLCFLVIGRLQNWQGEEFFLFLVIIFFFFCQPVKYVIHVYAVYWNQTKFPIHKVWWLRLRLIEQTFIPLCEKVI